MNPLNVSNNPPKNNISSEVDNLFVYPKARKAVLLTTWKGSTLQIAANIKQSELSIDRARGVLFRAKRQLNKQKDNPEFIPKNRKNVAFSIVENEESKFTEKFFPKVKRPRTSERTVPYKKVKFAREDFLKLTYLDFDAYQLRTDKTVPLRKLYISPLRSRTNMHLRERLKPHHENESILRLFAESMEYFKNKGKVPTTNEIRKLMVRFNKQTIEFKRSELIDLFKDFRGYELSEPDSPGERKEAERLLGGLFQAPVTIKKDINAPNNINYKIIYDLIDEGIILKSANAALLMMEMANSSNQ